MVGLVLGKEIPGQPGVQGDSCAAATARGATANRSHNAPAPSLPGTATATTRRLVTASTTTTRSRRRNTGVVSRYPRTACATFAVSARARAAADASTASADSLPLLFRSEQG